MDDLPQSMTMEEWYDLSYRAVHLGDPEARLALARLYRKAAHVKHNMRYAQFWLGMAFASYVSRGETELLFHQEIIDESSEIQKDQSEEEIMYMTYWSNGSITPPFGISDESAPSDEEVERFRKRVFQ